MSFQPPPSFALANARAMLADGERAISSGQKVIDFSGVTSVDSSAVATLLAWQREARAKSVTLSFINLPEMLQSLIDLYGVAELLPNQHDLTKFLDTPAVLKPTTSSPTTSSPTASPTTVSPTTVSPPTVSAPTALAPTATAALAPSAPAPAVSTPSKS